MKDRVRLCEWDASSGEGDGGGRDTKEWVILWVVKNSLGFYIYIFIYGPYGRMATQ